MFQTAPGVTIPFPEKIQEQFQVYEGQLIRANISFEKLRPILTEFYKACLSPCFLCCKCPSLYKKNGNLGVTKFSIKRYAILTGRRGSKWTPSFIPMDRSCWKTGCPNSQLHPMPAMRKYSFKSTNWRISILRRRAVSSPSYSVMGLRKPAISSRYGILFHKRPPVSAGVLRGKSWTSMP